MTESTDSRLARRLASLAVEIQAENGSEATLRAIADAAVHLIPDASWVGLSVIRDKRITPAFPTDEIAEAMDRMQSELREGPAFQALEEGQTIEIPDMVAEQRWPKFTAGAIALGVQCMLSLRLYVKKGDLGVLNIYGAIPDSFTDETRRVAEVLAQHAAVALAGAATEEQLRSAIESRDLIGQAKGILMHRDGLTGLQAFATLTRASQDVNLKLVEVARWLVEDHETKLIDEGAPTHRQADQRQSVD